MLSDNRTNNYFGIIFGEVAKYYQYLSIIYSRYLPQSERYISSIKAQLDRDAMRGDASWTMTAEEMAEYNLHQQQQTKLLLDLESFYLFSAIFLDRIAASTQYYFGPGQHNKQWGTFYSMEKYFSGYAQNKELGIPSKDLIDKMAWLYENVSSFRNNFLSHKHEKDQNIRSLFGLGFSHEAGGVYFSMGQMYPSEGEASIIAKKPAEIISVLNEFVEEWLGYVESNRAYRELVPPKA